MASKKIPLICSGHSRPVHEVSYSSITDDGFFMVSACLDGKPMLRNGMTGDWLGTFVGHKGAVWSAHIDSAALKVVTGSADYTAKVWDALTGQELHSFEHGRIVKSVNFSKDGARILTGGQDKILRIFDLEHLGQPLQIEGHTQPIKSARWCSNNTVISGGQDNELRIWDIRTLKQVGSRPHKSAITSIEVCLDNKHVITTCGKEIHFWNFADLTPVKSFTLGIELNTGSLSPDGTIFVVGGSSDSWSHVHDFASGKELEVNKGHHGPVHCVAFAPDGETYASGSEDGTIRLLQSGDPRCYGLWQDTKENTMSP